MKSVEFAKGWRHRVNETTVEEYSAGAKVKISNDRAEAARKAKVLKGDVVDVPDQTPGESDGNDGGDTEDN